MISEQELKEPVPTDEIDTAIDTLHGAPIPPIKRLEIMDSGSWEDLTVELATYWKTQYEKVVRCGGGGDKGRDVIAYDQGGDWENFQCKHYDHPLTLDEAVTEVGKLIYYVYNGEYTLPKKYFFVAPRGVATKLLDHLMDSTKLKAALLDRWDKRCRTKITATANIDLDQELIAFIDSKIDFEIFDQIPVLKIIELHSNTPYHVFRFGSTHHKRPKPKVPPSEPTELELNYISELLAAFCDATGKTVDQKNLSLFSEYEQEYNNARRNFYSADGLAAFSRDWLPDNSYEELLDECYEVISPIVLAEHKNGYERYLRSSAQAAVTEYAAHPLHHYIRIRDKKGLCHYLANEKRVGWVK